MISLLIILSVLLSIAFLVSRLKIKIETSYQDYKFKIKVFILKIKIFDNTNKKAKPKADENKKNNENKEEMDFLNFLMGSKDSLIEDIKEILNLVKMKAHITLFEINLTFGTKDAAQTGILTGELWALVGNILPLLYSSVVFSATPNINITPVFNNPCFEISYFGNFSVKLSLILKIAIKLLFKYKKYKGGVSNVSTASY